MNKTYLEEVVRDLQNKINNEPTFALRAYLNVILETYQKELDQARVSAKLTLSQLNDLIMPIAKQHYAVDQAYTKWVQTEGDITEGDNFIAFLKLWEGLEYCEEIYTDGGWREFFSNGSGESLETIYEIVATSFYESGDYDGYDWEDFPRYVE